MGFQRAGGKCVFSSEKDKFARQSYQANFNDDHPINEDITKIEASAIPDHDILLAGFPCQPFSLSGVSKRNSLGMAHGFADKTQGTLFFNVAQIIAAKRPQAFVLENVKNLKSHDKGNTFRVIMETLDELEYTVDYKILNADRFVPQNRERIFIVGTRKDVGFSFDQVTCPQTPPRLSSVLHPEDGSEAADDRFLVGPMGEVNPKYTLSDKLWGFLQRHAEKQQGKGNGFGYGLVDKNSQRSRTLTARYHKDGSEVLVAQEGRNPRKLTPRECARLMGFPEDWKIVVSDTQAYRQFGNAVVVPVSESIARVLVPLLQDSQHLHPAHGHKIF